MKVLVCESVCVSGIVATLFICWNVSWIISLAKVYNDFSTKSIFLFLSGDENTEEPRLLGLAMIPGQHVKSMYIDMDKQAQDDLDCILKAETQQIGHGDQSERSTEEQKVGE